MRKPNGEKEYIWRGIRLFVQKRGHVNRVWGGNLIASGFFPRCIYQFSGAYAKSGGKAKNHIQAGLLFAIFQSADKRTNHANMFTQPFLCKILLLPALP